MTVYKLIMSCYGEKSFTKEEDLIVEEKQFESFCRVHGVKPNCQMEVIEVIVDGEK